MKRYDKILTDPATIYRHPQQVLEDNQLNREQKIEVLKRWEYDARELEVATEENMLPPKGKEDSGPILHDQVLKALHQLEVYLPEDGPPTKQGGFELAAKNTSH